MNSCALDPISSLEELEVKQNQTKKTTAKSGTNSVASIEYETNPFSLENVENAIQYLGGKRQIDKDRIYHYYKLDPNSVTGDILEVIEKDSTHHILDYPFANAKIYNDEFGEKAEENIETLKDGNLYIVFKTGGELQNLFENNAELKAEKLDELYLPDDNDEELLIYLVYGDDYLRQEQMRICLFQRPRGRVQYLDQETGGMRSVPNIQVWSLVFGIPVATWTDGQGDYAISYRFSAGTLIGTHAKNPRINVKPLNTVGGFLQAVPQLASNFILGSTTTIGWRSACDMRNNININFNQHNQARYWAQILDAVRWHDTYTQLDRIQSAPYGLLWYAHWDDRRGAFSAPMLGHFNPLQFPTLPDVIDIIGFELGLNLSSISNNTKGLFKRFAPDITSRESNVMALSPDGQNHYSERFMQTCFHELAHASYFRKVGGGAYWSVVIAGVVFGGCDSPYGCGHVWPAGHIQLNEAWAEYLGKEHHRRLHTGGQAFIVERGRGRWEFYPAALESHDTFDEEWIPTGIFYDLTDRLNIREPNETINGFNIAQMYEVFAVDVTSICKYEDRFLQRYSSVTRNQFDNALIQNTFTNCLR